MSEQQGRILIGTASWTDPSLIACRRFYPADAGSPEQRLRFYAGVFPLVEVDASYYGMPVARTAAAWVARTPPGFIFNIKAYSLLTHHPTPPASLPQDVRRALPPVLQRERYIYYRQVPEELRTELWRRFAGALLPLDSAGKLGAVLCQFPPWFQPDGASTTYLHQLRERLPQYTVAVEFRTPAWFTAGQRAQTLGLLRDHGMPYVCVDEPQGTPASAPPLVAYTASPAMVRFHGRNRTSWGVREGNVAEKYNYLYSRQELQEWLPGIARLAAEAGEVHLLLNNCVEDKGVQNAHDLGALLREHPALGATVVSPFGDPCSGAAPAAQPRLL